MIDDPMLLDNDLGYCLTRDLAARRGVGFVRTQLDDDGGDLALYYFDDQNNDVFCIIAQHSFWIGQERVTKDALFDYLANNHLDHFEWLLFHPEWL